MDPTAALKLALDPSGILEAQGITADPWRHDFLVASGRQMMLNCSRQAGKRTIVAVLALHTAIFNPGSLTLLLCPAQRQSGELFRKVMNAYSAMKRPIAMVGETQLKMELANGSWIVCLPGREETIRSFSSVALLVIDEASRVPDDLYRSVRPMLAVSRGRLIALSTPWGQPRLRGFPRSGSRPAVDGGLQSPHHPSLAQPRSRGFSLFGLSLII